MGTLSIKLTASHRQRIPISEKVMEYYEDFMESNILKPKKIIINSKWNIWIGFMLTPIEKEKFTTIETYHFRSIKEENVRFYPIAIPVNLISDAKNIPLKIAEVFFEGIKLFFIENYKSIDEIFFNELWTKVDIEYLQSIPYPAPLKEISYIGENMNSLQRP